MFKLKYLAIIFLVLILLWLIGPTINVDAEDCYGSFSDDWRIWRWYEVLVIDENGKTQVWIRIDFEFFNSNMDNYVWIFLDVPAEKNQINYYPNNGTEASYIEFNSTSGIMRPNYSGIELSLKPETSLSYKDFSVCIQYNVSEDSILFKKSSKYSAIEKWELNTEMRVSKELFQKDPFIEKKLTAPFIQIFIILPRTSSVSSINENFHFYPKTRFNYLDRFQKLSYWDWNGSEIPNNYQIPFEIPSTVNVVLNYTEPYTPRYVSMEYSTENESFAKFTYDAMKAGRESKDIAIKSLIIAGVSVGIAAISVVIAIFARKDSKKYQHRMTAVTLEEKIAMMYAFNANAKDFEEREAKGEIDLDYTFRRINRDLRTPLELVSYLENNEQLKTLIDLTDEFLNKLSEDLKEKHKRSIREIENTFRDLKYNYKKKKAKKDL